MIAIMFMDLLDDPADEPRFTQMCEHYKNYIYAICFNRLHDVHLAEDCTWQTFEQAAKQFHKFDDDFLSKRVKNLLCTIAIAKCSREYAKQKHFYETGEKLAEREIDGETCALDEQGKMGFGSDYHFEDEDGRWIDVSKHLAGGWMGVDSEDHPIEILQYNNVDYYILHSDEDVYGVYWMIGGVQYDIGGTISREAIVKMAYQIR